MVIKQIFDTIDLITNKYRRGFIKTSQKLTAVKQAQLDFFNQELEVYRKQKFIPTSLKKFVKDADITLTEGVGNLPPDFAQENVFEPDCSDCGQGVFLSPEEYYDRLHSVILAPDQNNPVARINNGKIYVQPDEFSSVKLFYFRLPIEPLYATTVAIDGRSETFNSAASTDIEFSMDYAGEITRLALAYLGVAFQNQEALQLAVSANDNTQ
jgi:hypothetical protein